MSRLLGRTFRTLRDVFAAVPDVQCKGLCAAACTSLVGTRQERALAKQAGVDVLDPARPIGTVCPALVDERCTIYAARPLLCRVYGATPRLACPHGCQPTRWLREPESRHLFREALRLGGRQ